MTKGMVRNLDHLGRVTIPIEYRKALGVETLEDLELYTKDKVLHLKKGTGRKLDKLGRYTIPIEIRRFSKWEDGQAVDIYMEAGEICIRKVGEECTFCGSDRRLIKVDDNHICLVCLHKANATAKEYSL